MSRSLKRPERSRRSNLSKKKRHGWSKEAKERARARKASRELTKTVQKVAVEQEVAAGSKLEAARERIKRKYAGSMIDSTRDDAYMQRIRSEVHDESAE